MTQLWTLIVLFVNLLRLPALVRGQSTTDSYFERDQYLDNQYNHQQYPIKFQYPRSKYYYFFTPPSQVREVLEPLESTEQTDHVLEDRGYEQYEGYEAHWPLQQQSSKVVHQPSIHVTHHTVPYKEDKKDNYLLPLLLLAILPFLVGALVLLPLLFTFFTNLLQLLALIQQTVQNMSMNQTSGGRRKREFGNVNPVITSTLSSIIDLFVTSQDKYTEYSDE